MRWALVGAQGFAARVAAPAFAHVQDAELVGVLSRDRHRAQRLAAAQGAAVGTSDLVELLAIDGLEAVWVASPTHLHHEHAGAALGAGKHVLVEKPLAASSQEAWALVRQARAAGVVLATGYQARYAPVHSAVRDLAHEGVLGQVSVARTYYGIHRPGPPPQWRQHRRTARWGAFADVGTHHVDLLRMFFGEVVSASGTSGHRLGFETDDAVSASLRLDGDVIASLTVSTNVWRSSSRIEVHGSHGSVVAEDTSPAGGGSTVLHRHDREPVRLPSDPASAWVAQLRAVTAAAGGQSVAYATGVDGARNLEVLEQVLP